MRRVVAVALTLVAATAVSHILRARLVAMSPQPTGLPPFVWLAVTSPSWMTGLTGGMCLRSWRQIALAALLAAVALQSYETWAINAPLLFWTVSIPATAGGIFSLLAAGRLIRLATQRLRVQRPGNDAHVASYEAFRDAGRRVKGPGALLIDTFRMYGSHWAGLVLACAVLWVPAVVVKQATYRLIAPGISDWMPEATAILREKIRTGRIDPEAAKSVRSAMEQALGGRAVRVLGRVTGFLFDDLIIPLIGGALSILVANRLLGGSARAPAEAAVSPDPCGHPADASRPNRAVRRRAGALRAVRGLRGALQLATGNRIRRLGLVVSRPGAHVPRDDPSLRVHSGGRAVRGSRRNHSADAEPRAPTGRLAPCLSRPRRAHGHPRTRGDILPECASSSVVPRRCAHGPLVWLVCGRARPHAAPGGRGGAPLFRSTAQARWFR